MILLVLGALLFATQAVQAQSVVAVGSQFQVNTYTTGDQGGPAVAMDTDGDFVVVWISLGSDDGDTSGSSVQGRRYASDGSPRGSQFQINSYTTDSQGLPEVASAPNGDFVVVWTSLGSYHGDTSGFSVQGQRYAFDGSPRGFQFQINSYTTDYQWLPDVAAAPNGDFAVVWTSNSSDNGDTSGQSIQGQRYASDGGAHGAQFLVNSYTTYDQIRPKVAIAPDGNFVVVWASNGSDNGYTPGKRIQGQRYASDGSTRGSQFLVSTYTPAGDFEPAVAMDPDGDFVVVWTAYTPYTGYPFSGWDIQGRRFASNGDPLGSQFLVNSYTTRHQSTPDIGIDAKGDFLVVWRSYWANNGDPLESIQGQLYSSDGNAVDSQFLVNTYTTHFQFVPKVAARAGDFVVVWASYGSDGGDTWYYSVQAQRFRKSRIFADGFESGQTSSWSTSVGESP